ncbi:MAG: HEAT repeat domain-containing protein [Thermoleophilia bacterium]|nr:HEAT repeat domain-containing protein [Thermoleophilia bacterium]
MSLAEVLLTFVGGTIVVWLFMTFLVVISKVGRDRREIVSKDRRGRYRDALGVADTDQLEAACRELAGNEAAQVDMLAALEVVAAGPRAIDSFRDADRRHQLSESLEFQSCGEAPVARGISTLLLARMGLDRRTTVAAGLLQDEDADVRLAACSALAEIGTNAAARSLIQALRESLMPAERLIERLGAPWANEEVLLALNDSDDPHLRVALIRVLGLSPDPRALELLIHFSRHSEEIEERISAIRTLGSTGLGETVLPVLCPALDDESPAVRAQAARAIGAIYDSRPPDAPDESNVTAKQLRRCLGDQDWWVRANAATSLRSLGSAGELQLRDALDDPDEFSRARARESLALLESKRAAG